MGGEQKVLINPSFGAAEEQDLHAREDLDSMQKPFQKTQGPFLRVTSSEA